MQVSMIASSGGSDDPNIVPKRRKQEEELLDPTVPNNHPILKVCMEQLRISAMQYIVWKLNFQ